MTARLDFILTAPAIPMLLVAVVIFLFGWTALVRDRPTAVNVSFYVLTLCAAHWLACTAMVMMSPTEAIAEVWARITYVGICLIPAAVLQFTFALLEQLRLRRSILVTAWTGSAVFVVLFATNPHFITGVWRYPWGFYPRLGVASATFLSFFTILLVASIVALRSSAQLELTGQQKKRVRAFLVALAVGYIACVDYLPSFGVPMIPVGSIAVLGFVVLSIRTIRRFSFADITSDYLAERLMETVQGGVIVADMHGSIRVANPAAERLLGAPGDQLIGSDLQQRLQTADAEVSIATTLLRDHEEMPVG
ncbi:MAG TPA: histidine kinase N-terminal 7TM domain-containing protein, partial [Vicinamibacterales bacterium]|nr:histidine kinase N-terminal 7TM domain-containing protein [Vicinamibacterales bacterium]